MTPEDSATKALNRGYNPDRDNRASLIVGIILGALIGTTVTTVIFSFGWLLFTS